MAPKVRTSTLLLLCAALAPALVAGCGGSAPPPPAAKPGKPVDPATAGSISGRVTFKGDVPAAEVLRMGSDQACVQGAGPNPVSDAVLVSSDGGLKNVFVYVKEGLDPAYGFDVPAAPVVLDQKGCVYMPRVVGLRVGQPIEVLNSDPTLHNVHGLPNKNPEFNASQPIQGIRTTRTFSSPDVMVRFKCDVHNWMTAYVGVLDHPYFAVTSGNGGFELRNLPPGTYTIEAWHEKFGTQTAKITVADKQAQTASFTFTSKPNTEQK
jgi:plastocyanin